MNKRRYKGFDYEARNPAPPPEEQPDPPAMEATVTSATSVSGDSEDAKANEVRLQE